MYLNALRIDDFGCFRNARLDTLDDNLVVIGGPQRAGKSTFMQALRQFPSGVSRSGDLPPATDDYRVDAEITHDGHCYRYVLNGYASPSVSPIDGGPEIAPGDIFGPVTERQYRNLYTISLDELRRLPPGIDDSDDLARILLGGAYGDIAEIPEIKESFDEQAYEIGLTKGNPNTTTSQLHDPYQKIRDGIEARKEASQQVEEYRSVTQDLNTKRSNQSNIEGEIRRKQRTRDRLNVLKELFVPLQELNTLDARLDGVDHEAIDKFPTHLADRLDHFEAQFEMATEELIEARQEFHHEATIETTDNYDEWLLENEGEIDTLTEKLTLWSMTAEELTERQEGLEEKRVELEREISSLHSDWDESFTHIETIKTSVVDTARVTDIVSTIEELRTKRGDVADSLESDQTRKEELETKLDQMEKDHEETREITIPKRMPAIVAGIAIAAGTGVGLATTPLVGGVAGLIFLGIGLYVIDSTVTIETSVDADPYREIRGQVTTLEGDIKTKSERRVSLDEQISDIQEELDDLVTALGLPAELPPGEVPDFYDSVVELSDTIETYRRERNEWQTDTENFTTDLEDVATLLKERTAVPWSAEEPLEGAESMVSTLESIAVDLELARGMRRAEREREDRIEEIDAVLTEWDAENSIDASTGDKPILQHIHAFNDETERVSNLRQAAAKRDQLKTQVSTRLKNPSAQAAFESLRENDEPWTAVVRDIATNYADTDAITDEIRKQNSQIEDLKREYDSGQETCIELEQRQDELASEDDLQVARATIDEGRIEFERLGESYAVNRIAESLVTQLHERLMEDVVHSLVDDASTIFSEITQEYEGIELDGDIQTLEFHALRNGKPAHSIGELSRATAEQLFLAVRLARIRQTEVTLPIVLDDAATNFDPDHMRRVFNVVSEVTGTNQVFFLTCHPQCVRMTASNSHRVQYWSLNDGRFALSETADSLEQHLSVE